MGAADVFCAAEGVRNAVGARRGRRFDAVGAVSWGTSMSLLMNAEFILGQIMPPLPQERPALRFIRQS